MPKLFRTLRGQLLVGLLVPLVAIAIVNLWFSYRNARATAYNVLDHTLAASANSVAEQVRARGDRLTVDIPPAALGMFSSGYADIVYYRVVDERGRLLSGYGDLPAPVLASADPVARYTDAQFRERKIRSVTVVQPVPSPAGTLYAYVTVAVTLDATQAMVNELWLSSGLEQLALVGFAFVLAWLSLLRAFAPLLRMRNEVASRRPNEFKPFDEHAVQRELVPFITALNQYMERLSRQINAQRRFIANAAHQLRTPLTLLRTQAQVALREDDASRKDEAARGVIETTKHMTRLTNQLLVLSKTDGESPAIPALTVDLVYLTRSVLEEYADLAVARSVDLAFDALVSKAWTLGDSTMLREVVANLTDNALRYAAGCSVEVQVDANDSRVFLRVLDSGPGIPLEDRELVFERFYRIKERAAHSDGSGLGLSIVRDIVTASGGTIELGDNPNGRGLLVSVSLPRVPLGSVYDQESLNTGGRHLSNVFSSPDNT